MAGMTKKQCQAFEKLAESLITGALGAGTPYLETALKWTFPHANGATVEMTLFRDSFDAGNVYRHSWLACRLNYPRDWSTAEGYAKPRADVPWPSSRFTFPSGKCNYSPREQDDAAQWRRELIMHLYGMAAEGPPEKLAFGSLDFETC